MLLAYIDEIGEPGAFVSQDHPRYKTSPGFGYAGFVIPEEHVREFGAIFTSQKRNRFAGKAQGQDIKYLEVKGSELFRVDTPSKNPEHLRTHESKVHLFNRSLEDIHNTKILGRERPLYPPVSGQRVGDALHRREVARILAASQKNQG